MSFAATLALSGATYFLCSLGYLLTGLVLAVELRRGAHRAREWSLFGLLSVYGFIRGLYHFAELFFLISFQRTSPMEAGGLHETIWVVGDYLTVLIFFAYAWRLGVLDGSSGATRHRLALGLLGYWTLVLTAAHWLGLPFGAISTWHVLKPFLICLPSFVLVAASFARLGQDSAQLGQESSARGFRWLARSYGLQAGMIFVLASMELAQHRGMGAGPLVVAEGFMALLRSGVVIGTVYLIYLVLDRGQEAGEDSLQGFGDPEGAVAGELGRHVVHQVCHVLEVDAAAVVSMRTGEAMNQHPAAVLASQGFAPRTLSRLVAPGELCRAGIPSGLYPRYRAFYQLPIAAAGGQVGCLVVANRRRRPLSPEDRRFLTSLVEEAGEVFSSLRALADRVEARAIQEERLRISRELHDGMSPLLAYVRLKIELAKGLLQESDQNPLSDTLGDIDKVVAEAFADVREAITGLRTSVEAGTLGDKLRALAGPFERAASVRLDLDILETLPELSPKVEAHVLRIVQEALTNIRKHAHATRAWLEVRRTATALEVVIRDDGCGFAVTPAPEGHFGLNTMHERSLEIGGVLQIDSRPGAGTAIRLTLPGLGEEEERADAKGADRRRSRLVPGGLGEPDLV